MPIPRHLIREIRRLDAYDLRRLQILIRGLLMDDEPAGGPPRTGAVTFRQQHVRCGKQGCTKCPHGPYWYAFWREDGRSRSRYVGRTLPDAGPDAPGPDVPGAGD